MRRHHQLRGLFIHPRVLLYEAGDAHALLGETLAEGGQHTGAVIDTHAVIGARLHLTHRDHADTVVEAERWPALHAAADRPSKVDQVPDHR